MSRELWAVELTADDVKALKDSWNSVGRALPHPDEWRGELVGSFAALDYFIRHQLKTLDFDTIWDRYKSATRPKWHGLLTPHELRKVIGLEPEEDE